MSLHDKASHPYTLKHAPQAMDTKRVSYLFNLAFRFACHVWRQHFLNNIPFSLLSDLDATAIFVQLPSAYGVILKSH